MEYYAHTLMKVIRANVFQELGYFGTSDSSTTPETKKIKL